LLLTPAPDAVSTIKPASCGVEEEEEEPTTTRLR
jgi:hypothetical protein